MKSELENLLREYPFPKDWEPPELFQEIAVVGRLSLPTWGLVSRRTSGEMVTGSSCGEDRPSFARAFFELLERMSIVEAERTLCGPIPLWGIDRARVGERSPSEVFCRESGGGQWQYARSNGVACHSDREEACRRASRELVERDRILASWFGECPPQPVAPTSGLWPLLDELYEVRTYLFPDTSSEVSVAGAFAFPKSVGIVLSYGFAAGTTRRESLEKAEEECVQRLCFLSGAAIEEKAPEFAPTAQFHQEWYLRASGTTRLRAWLSGAHGSFVGKKLARQTPRLAFVDLTPPPLRGKLWIVKAISDELRKLTFGYGPIPESFPKELSIHPIV